MSAEPAKLDYADDRARQSRRKWTRYLFAIIVAKVVMVIVNVTLLLTPVWPGLRMIGIGVQVGLTMVFLVVLMRLATQR